AAGIANPDTHFDGGRVYQEKAGPSISNFGGEYAPPGNLTDALTNSVNIVFARLGDELGAAKLRKAMQAFGFNQSSPLEDLPSSELSESGLYGTDGKPLAPDQPIDVARVAIGQERLGVTPLQMALVAASIGNHGKMMRPYLVQKIVHPDGTTVDST